MATPPTPPGVSRAVARRMLRPYLTPITALAIAGDRAAAAASKALYRHETFRRYWTKTEGNHIAVLWTEAVRLWVYSTDPPHLRVHEPYDWTELLVGDVDDDVIHARIQRDRARPLTPRRSGRKQQAADLMLPAFVDKHRITNVDINAVPSVSGRIRAVRAEAPFGRRKRDALWAPIDADMREARRLLDSWERREVPWLEPIRRVLDVAATSDRAAIIAERERQLDELEASLRNGPPVDLRGGSPTEERHDFTMRPNPAAEAPDGTSDGVADTRG